MGSSEPPLIQRYKATQLSNLMAKLAIFPVNFPVCRELTPENGSLQTPSTAILLKTINL